MPKLPILKAKKIIKVLLKNSFYVHHQTGSHVQLRNLEKTNLRVTVPRHDAFDIPPSILNSILKQAEISRDQFIKLINKK